MPIEMLDKIPHTVVYGQGAIMTCFCKRIKFVPCLLILLGIETILLDNSVETIHIQIVGEWNDPSVCLNKHSRSFFGVTDPLCESLGFADGGRQHYQLNVGVQENKCVLPNFSPRWIGDEVNLIHEILHQHQTQGPGRPR